MSLTTTVPTLSSIEARVYLWSEHENLLWHMEADKNMNPVDTFIEISPYLTQVREQIHSNRLQPTLNTIIEYSPHTFSSKHIAATNLEKD